MLPHDFPPWEAVYQQPQRWLTAGVFEAMVHDLRGAAPSLGPASESHCGDPRQPHAALNSRERPPRRL
jgi:transposase